MNVKKIRGKRIFEIVHCPFELPPNQHQPTGPFGWHKWCSLARPLKGQCTILKILSSLIFSLFIEQNIFFLETCFAYTISEPKFTVCCMLCYCCFYFTILRIVSELFSAVLSEIPLILHPMHKFWYRICIEYTYISFSTESLFMFLLQKNAFCCFLCNFRIIQRYVQCI